jgi:hypothetical protein
MNSCVIANDHVCRYLEESLRWLVANGRKKGVINVLERAAKTNGKRLSDVLRTLESSHDTGNVLVHISLTTFRKKTEPHMHSAKLLRFAFKANNRVSL